MLSFGNLRIYYIDLYCLSVWYKAVPHFSFCPDQSESVLLANHSSTCVSSYSKIIMSCLHACFGPQYSKVLSVYLFASTLRTALVLQNISKPYVNYLKCCISSICLQTPVMLGLSDHCDHDATLAEVNASHQTKDIPAAHPTLTAHILWLRCKSAQS